MRPCIQSAVPSIGKMSGNRSPWPVARPIASARSACAPGRLEAIEVHLGGREVHERVQAPGELLVG